MEYVGLAALLIGVLLGVVSLLEYRRRNLYKDERNRDEFKQQNKDKRDDDWKKRAG